MPSPALTLWVLPGPSGNYLDHLRALPPSVSVVVGKDPAAFTGPPPDIILNSTGGGELLSQLWPRVAASVRWVHSLSTGVERGLIPELRDSAAVFTNSRGLFARSLGEYALAAMLFFAKDLRRMVAQQQARVWKRFEVEELHGRTLGIVGYGGIGRACAERARAFGLRVLATRRRAVDPEATEPFVDRMVPRSGLDGLLAESDYVVLSAPETPETVGMIGEAQLRRMKPTAVLINLARGPLVVEEALIRALRERWIRGAALDVFDQEPLPSDHPFFTLDNLLLSPHCADRVPGYLDAPMAVFLRNFERFVKGEPLAFVVDKAARY